MQGSRRLRAALLLPVFGLAAVACGGDDSKDRALLELRPVLAANPPPCPDEAPDGDRLVRPLSTDGKVTECLELGPPIVDARDVRSATMGDTTGGLPAISVVLGNTGSTNLDEFAARNEGQRLAILTEGDVVNAPVIRFKSFAGRVQVTGLPKERTDDLFRRLDEFVEP